MPPELESRLRTIKFAHYLGAMGYDVTVFASSIMHNMGINLIENGEPYIEKRYGDLKFVHINTRLYRKNDINRVIGLWQFPRRFLKVARKYDAPDVVLHTASVPFGSCIGNYIKSIHAKYIVEILDLKPETFVDLGIIGKNNPILPVLYNIEKKLYTKADEVVFSMEGGREYVLEKKWNVENGGSISMSKIHYINNGVDIDDFDTYKTNYSLGDPDLEDENTKKVIYLGSIRLANNLKSLIDAAELMKEEPTVKFIIYGNGDDRDYLEKYCISNNLSNVLFKEKWIAPKYVPYVLSHATVNILNYMPGSFGKYGGSQSKLFQYMASGRPICSNIDMMYCQINKYHIGVAREFRNAEEYVAAIKSILDLPENEYKEMCARARKAAYEFDYKKLTQKMCELL